MKSKFSIRNKAFIALVLVPVLALVVVIIAAIGLRTKPTDNPTIQKTETDKIEVTAEDLEEYRRNIGNSMDVKKSALIIFNSAEECQAFINDYGNNENVLTLVKGILPQMQEKDGKQYFNVVGNAVFEPLFDSLQDGEYMKKPVGYGGAYCYFKRLENYSITENDEDLKEFIKREKTMEKGGEVNEKTD